MAGNLSPEQGLKRLRELLPENGKDIPDEFIITILDSCNYDLNTSFEELQQRLSRASWESVDKSKKKKAEKQQNGHLSHQPNDRRRAPANGKYEGRSSGFHSGKENQATSSTYPKRNTASDGRSPPSGSKTLVKPEISAARVQVVPVAAVPSEVPAVQEKPLERAPAPPRTNQWAKGRPQVIPEPQKKLGGKIAEPATIQDQDESLDLQEPRLVDGGSLESSQTDETAETLRTSEEAETYQPNSSSATSLDQQVTEDFEVNETQAPTQNATNVHSAGENTVDDVESTAADFESLKVEYAAPQEQSARPIQTPTTILDPMPTHTVSGNAERFIPGHQQMQDAYSTQASYSQYAAYQNQFQPPQQQFSSMQDSAFNGHKMYYNPAAESAQTNLPVDASNRSGFSVKGMPAPKQQPQQPTWQSPMMNSYGMMPPNMYMTPQQMMYMQSYGMGMGFGASALNGQIYNGGAAYPPQPQHNFSSSKGQFNHPASHKKQTGYGGSFGQQGFAANTYSQPPARAEDQYKFRASQGAENFEGNHPYSYPNMGFSFDNGMQSQGFAAAGRCSTSVANASAGMTADDSPYFSRGPYFGQADSQGQSQGQWIGGN